MSGDLNMDGWCDWTYKGVDHSVPGNGGLECRNYLKISQRLLESVAACAVAVFAIIYAWSHLKLPEICSCIHHQKHEPLGKRILLVLMCLTFGIELGFKFATRQMIWIGNPCHIVTMLQIFILAAPPSRTVTAVFRLHMHMLAGAPIAILFPVINSRLLPFETAVYFIQHILMLAIPFYLLHIGDPFIPEPLGDFSWALSSLGFLYIYHFVPLQTVAYMTHVNLNNMLCPAVSDPFSGQFYRLFAICHQFVLILILGKVVVIIARIFRILPYDNPSDVVDKYSCAPKWFSLPTTWFFSNRTREISTQCSAGDGITDSQSDCACTTLKLKSRYAVSDAQTISHHCSGDSNPVICSCCNCDAGSREFINDCYSSDNYSTQYLVNGCLVRDGETKDDEAPVRRMKHKDISCCKSPETREADKNYESRKIHLTDYSLSKPKRGCTLCKTQLASDKGEMQNGHTKSH